MTTPDGLVQALTGLIVELAWFIDSTIDVDGEPRGAMKQVDLVAGTFDRLTPEQRTQLAAVVDKMADAESSPSRHEFLKSFPDNFGLSDDA